MNMFSPYFERNFKFSITVDQLLLLMKIEVCYGILNILRRCSRPKPFETTLGHKGQ